MHEESVLGIAITVILGLIGVVWGVNNSRIGALEKWRREVKLDALATQIAHLEADVRELKQEVKRKP